MRKALHFAAALAASLFASVPAFAATILTVTSLGLTAPNANIGCPIGSPDCFGSRVFQLAAPATATGTITINTAGTSVSFNLDVASITFSSVPAGGADAVFSNVQYFGITNVISGPGFVSQFPPAATPGTVSGLFNGNPFSTGAGVTLLSCSYGASTGQCGFAMNPGFEVGGYKWLHTFDVFVSVATTPEASLLWLVFAGAAAGVTLRRR